MLIFPLTSICSDECAAASKAFWTIKKGAQLTFITQSTSVFPQILSPLVSLCGGTAFLIIKDYFILQINN